MNRIRAAVIAGLTIALVALSAAPAFAHWTWD